MARSRHTKSQSVSSNTGDEVLVNGSMPPPASPPAPPASLRASPNLTRHRKTPSTAATTSPVVLTNAVPKPGAAIPSIPPHQPSIWRFFVAAGLSVLLEATLQSFASQVNAGDLAAVSRHSESWVEVAGLLGWKITTLAIYWFGGFDAYDVASLTLLLRTPSLFLLSKFYLIRTATITTTTASTLIANAVPFLLLRPLLPQHDPQAHPHAPRTLLRNKSILTDPYTAISTSVLGAAILAVILELSFQTFLPVWLVTHFTGIRSLEFVHGGPAGLPVLLLLLLPAGYAARTFLFTPSTGVTDLTTTNYTFDTTTAGFLEHIKWNVWGWYTPRQKELISRTTLLAALVLLETVLKTWIELKGIELSGAVGYAGVWAAGVIVTGMVLDWVGEPSD